MADTTTRVTRSSMQRAAAAAAADENLIANPAKGHLGQKALRTRKALDNISNNQAARNASKAAKDVLDGAQKGAITRRKSRELAQAAQKDAVKAAAAKRALAQERADVALSSRLPAPAKAAGAQQTTAADAGERAKVSKPRLSTGAAQVAAAARKGKRANDAKTGMTRMLVGHSESTVPKSLLRRTEELQIEAQAQEVMPESPLPDIDSKDKEDCLACADYAPDIFTFFRNMEPHILIPPDYMEKQEFINRQMRAVLIDWIIDTHQKYELIPESLFLGIHIMDKFLSNYTCRRKELQLVGLCSLIIANKYEEVYGPSVRDFAKVCGKQCQYKEVLAMERVILKVINFELTVPTSFTFLSRYIKACPYGHYPEFAHLSQYLCEWALLSCTCLRFPGSMIAASAIHVSIKAFNLPDENGWPYVLRKHTGYTHRDLWSCAQYLAFLMDKGSRQLGQFQALYNKFKSPNYSGVARYKAPIKAFGLEQFVEQQALAHQQAAAQQNAR